MPGAVTALFAALHAGDAQTVAALVRAQPELLSARSPSGLSPVLFATYYQQPELAAWLIAAGAPLDVHEAAAAGALGPLCALLDAQPALTSAPGADGFTPLGLAALFGREEVAAALLARGAAVNAPSRNAQAVRPLDSAVAGHHLGTVRRLLVAGADVNAATPGALSPLMNAAQNGRGELVELLVAHGADHAARTAEGETAADLARAEGHTALAQRLTLA